MTPNRIIGLSDGRFRLDGGAMFGVVPRVLWERANPPDASNRILLGMNCLLIEGQGFRILVDTGVGDKEDDAFADMFALERTATLLDELAARGLRPEDITHVVNTHLHIDHSGCNELFPNALSYAHRFEEPPIGSTRISGALTLLPGVEIVPTPGHTEGSISVFVSAEKRYAICGDAIPTKANYDAHVPPFVAFDKNLATKSMEMILDWAQVVVPGHGDPFDVLRKR